MSESAVFDQRVRELLGRLNEAENSMALLARERDDATRRAVNAERDLDLALRSPRDPSVLARHYIDAAAADGDGWMNLKAQAEATKEAVDVSLVVETTGGPTTVADLLRARTVVEWQVDDGWFQAGPSSFRWWHRGARQWSGWVGTDYDDSDPSDPHLPARLVPASEADADPATRGPIDGSGGGA